MAFAADKTRQGAAGTGGGYEIDYSCRMEQLASVERHFTRTPSSAGNRKTWTWSSWVKFSHDTAQNRAEFFCADNGGTPWWNNVFTISTIGNVLRIDNATSASSTATIKSNMVLRDQSAWYHIHVIWDTTQGTNTNRIKAYVNGVQVTSWYETTWPSQNSDGWVNYTGPHTLGTGGNGGASYGFDGYMAETHFIDGTAVAPTEFGEFGDYGDWKPIEVSGLTYGTNGFYLDYADSGDLGDDESGNTNDWTENNIRAGVDQMLDSPTNNFCTLDRAGHQWPKRSATMSAGNLRCWDNSSDWTHANGTMAFPKDKKIYFEVLAASQSFYAGIALVDGNAGAYSHGSRPDGGWTKGLVSAYTDSDTAIAVYRTNTGGTALGNQNFGSLSNVHDGILGIAVDQANSNVKFYVNGSLVTSQGANGNTNGCFDSGKDYLPVIAGGGSNLIQVVNFGQDSSFGGEKTAQGNQDDNGIGDFYYEPPSGYLALCTANLPATITPSEHFNALLYSGTGATQSITGVGFQPDLVWNKRRSGTSNHAIFDAIRGATKYLSSSATGGEGTYADSLTSFDADGFTFGADTSSAGDNGSGTTAVSWNWKANGSGSSNTDGTINTTATSANVDAGFSIVSYTGTGTGAGAKTIGHGLSSAPEMIIIKSRDDNLNWSVYHTAIGNTHGLRLEDTSAKIDFTYWNDTSPTASVFTVGPNNYTNKSGSDFIAYCFHSVDGYSKVGSYTGNSNADGTFIYTGFRPAWVLVKRATGADSWYIYDTARNEYNVMNKSLLTDTSAAEGTDGAGAAVDYVSNGFKWRLNSGSRNDSTETYIYLAFAETPFKYSNAR